MPYGIPTPEEINKFVAEKINAPLSKPVTPTPSPTPVPPPPPPPSYGPKTPVVTPSPNPSGASLLGS